MTIKPMITATLVSALALASPLAAQEATKDTTQADQTTENSAQAESTESQDSAKATESTDGGDAKTLSQIEPTPGLTADKVTDTQVAAFVDALVAIERVRVTYMPKIEATTDGEARSALIDQANAAVVKAVDNVENMSISDYIAIDKAAQESGELNDRIMAEIAELRDEAESDEETKTQ